MSAWDDAIDLVCDGDAYIRGNSVYTRNLFTLEDFIFVYTSVLDEDE